jgi:hypothetical protein
MFQCNHSNGMVKVNTPARGRGKQTLEAPMYTNDNQAETVGRTETQHATPNRGQIMAHINSWKGRIMLAIVVVIGVIASSVGMARPAGGPGVRLTKAAASTNFSEIPHGYSDYAKLHTSQGSYSDLPRGYSDYVGVHTVSAQPNLSEPPRGYTDHMNPGK